MARIGERRRCSKSPGPSGETQGKELFTDIAGVLSAGEGLRSAPEREGVSNGTLSPLVVNPYPKGGEEVQKPTSIQMIKEKPSAATGQGSEE